MPAPPRLPTLQGSERRRAPHLSSNPSVPQHQDAIRHGCGFQIVRHHHHRTFRVVGDAPQHAQHRTAVPGIQRARGFVREDHVRAARKRSGDGHALLLAAGQIAGATLSPAVEAYAFQHRARLRLRDGTARQARGQRHVLPALSDGMRLYDWKMKPTWSRRVLDSALRPACTICAPIIWMEPESAASNPDRQYSSVDFPDPLGPRCPPSRRTRRAN